MAVKIFNINIILCLLFLFSVSASGAVSIDATRVAGDFAPLGGVRPTSVTISQHPVGSGANRVLIVGVSTYSTVLNPAPQRVLRITFGPQAGCPVMDQTCNFTRIGTQSSPITDPSSVVEMFVLIAPPNDTRDIEVTLVPLTVDYVVAGSISFFGASQTTPPFFSNNGTFDGNNQNTAPNVTVTGGVSGDIVLDTMAIEFNALTASPASGQTEQWNGKTFFSNTATVGGGSTKPVPANPPFTVTMSWDSIINAGDWAIGAVLMRQSIQTASPSSINGRVLTRSGRGVSKAFVYLTDNAGEKRLAVTNPFGYFRFDDVETGETYIVSVKSKRSSFTSQVISVTNDINELIFTAQP